MLNYNHPHKLILIAEDKISMKSKKIDVHYGELVIDSCMHSSCC